MEFEQNELDSDFYRTSPNVYEQDLLKYLLRFLYWYFSSSPKYGEVVMVIWMIEIFTSVSRHVYIDFVGREFPF